MTLFKCKMCGGTLEINNETVATCEYCGTQQTLPRLDDDRKTNLYDRANHFRRNNEFDKAMGIYEQILNEDNTDAEAYWSLVLCRYGIEYVEDPSSHKRIPTVNRTQFTSVFDDDNYKSALQYADGYQRNVYEEEARAINEIQKGILAISQKEEPFDVFICYKETDNNGRRTPDSVLANDLYHQLMQEGFKVFFARITLEDKLGSAYEPYIFAALNSAKVMVVLGTKPEYFNAVWVKNEWSRYLALIKQGQKKMLIPAYKDMDPYDLPEEFSHLQAQDMSKLGFMQDLIRGIKKIAQAEEPKTTVVKETVVTSANANTVPLLKRVFMFLEDEEWARADDFCEQVLNLEPECAEAYLGKLMVELKVTKKELLKDCAEPFVSNNNYKKALRFGNEKLNTELVGYIESINARNEEMRLLDIYTQAHSVKAQADEQAIAQPTGAEHLYKEAAKLFESIRHYKDSDEQAKLCYEDGGVARKNALLIKALELKKEASYSNVYTSALDSYKAAIILLGTIPGWKNSDQILAECKVLVENLKHEFTYRQAVSQKNTASKAAANAEKAYKDAARIFDSIREYKDSAALAQACYEKAEDARKNAILIKGTPRSVSYANIAYYESSIRILEQISGWKDADEQIAICKRKIEEIKAKEEAERIEKEHQAEIARLERTKRNKKIAIITTIVCAIIAFIIVLNTVIIPNGKYNDAIALMDAGNIVEAYEALVALDGYKDSAEKANSIYDKYKVEKLKVAKTGDYLFFGAYDQDNNTSNGKEDIEWLVLEVNDGKALVISKYALDCKQYNAIRADVTWETSTLRKWLNNDFINVDFSADEKAMIPTVTVSADKNPYYSTNPGNATQDQVFLLSITEANKYFSSDSARRCEPTDYAVANGVHVNRYDGNCRWWLRSPGDTQNDAASVIGDGDVDEPGRYVDDDSNAVRPALWIDLNS